MQKAIKIINILLSKVKTYNIVEIEKDKFLKKEDHYMLQVLNAYKAQLSWDRLIHNRSCLFLSNKLI